MAKKTKTYLPKTKTRLPLWLVLFAGLGLGLYQAQNNQVLALETMTSPNYSIQMGNFNITSGEKSSSSYTMTDTVGELTPGQFDSTGYTVLSGFQYIYALPEFSFRISKLNIDLGTLDPGNFHSDSNELIITTRSAGYTILAQAQHQLRTPQNSEIAATTCDVLCTLNSANLWVNPVNTGFGYRVTGPHASSDFSPANTFRPFASAANSEPAQTIAAHNTLVTDEIHTVTYQASISESQPAGSYSTVINFTAVPNY